MSVIYRYELKLPSYMPRIGTKVTGTFKVPAQMTHSQVEAFAKEMSHGIFNAGKLVSYTETPL